MSSDQPCPVAVHRSGDELYGFRLERVTQLAEIRATAYEAVHLRTGAQLIHLHCADQENLFAVTFRTPPPDSTGVAHILEHSVLAGSKRYPVKDAFTELGKGSLKTFINAFTAPDFTCYPVASQVKADFYNLASVYTDLVFRPLLTKSTFMQEGHHLEVNEEGELEIAGIVYNEMKGAFSTPEAVSERWTLHALFPDTPYGQESGGDPEKIPDLTYEDFRDFHRRYYSPGNSRIFLYGNIPTEEHLRFLAGELAGFERLEVHSQVPLQSAWTVPREVRQFYPVGQDDPVEGKTTVNVAWLTAEAADQEQRLILGVLEEALVGTAASPLRKALIDSGLGEDLSPATGLQTWFRQAPFIVGLRGTDPEKSEEIERLALSTLEEIARDGLPPDQLEAAFHQVEFAGLEISRSPYLFPLTLLFRTLTNWLHDQDPLAPLRFPTLMAGLRERWQREPDLFADAVRRWLLNNPHRVRAVIAPSRTLASEQEEKVRLRLAGLRASMSEREFEDTRATAATLLQTQRAGESVESLATLPVLRLDEIPRDVVSIPTEVVAEEGVTFLEHELFTNGIAYLDVGFDLSSVPEDLVPYLPFLGAVVTGMGAAGMGYEAFSTKKALRTGGIGSELKVRDLHRAEGTLQIFFLRGKALLRNVEAMVQIMREIIEEGDLADRARLKDILSEERNETRAVVAPRGHIFGWRAAAAGFSLGAYRDEQWHGVSQLRFLNTQVPIFEVDPTVLQGNLRRLREIVFRREGMMVNLTGDSNCLRSLRGPVRELIRGVAVGGGASPAAAPRPAFPHSVGRPGVALPGEVCYVARVLPAPKHNDPGAPVVLVLSNHLGDGVLYRKIRVEGGAYGGLSFYNHSMGQFAMLSYRDPNLEKTLEVYDQCFDSFLEEELAAEDVRKAIISTIANLDRPMDPATQGMTALERHLVGLTDADRQRFREEILATDRGSMRRVVEEILRPAMAQASDAVFAPKERIEEANAALAAPFEIGGME